MRNGPYELVKAPEGYPGKRYRGLYCYEHHLVYWETHGVVPGPGELIHHMNGKKRDNRPGNLELVKRADHGSRHAHPAVDLECPECGKAFQRTRARVRFAAQRRSGLLFCGRKCAGRYNARQAG